MKEKTEAEVALNGVVTANVTEAGNHQSPTKSKAGSGHLRITKKAQTDWPKDFKLTVMVPVYNESATMLAILDKVLAVDVPKEIIIVDDGSTDGTRELLKEQVEGKHENVVVVFHKANRGKGAAIRTAIRFATGSVCLVQDADLELDPNEYPRLLEPIVNDQADVVYGSRFLNAGAHRLNFFWHYISNFILTTFSNMLTNLHLTDMETCYKVVRTDVLRKLPLRSNGFDIEPEITAKLARAKVRIWEVPVTYVGRDYKEGKKINWTDGVQAILAIIRYRLRD